LPQFVENVGSTMEEKEREFMGVILVFVSDISGYTTAKSDLRQQVKLLLYKLNLLP